MSLINYQHVTAYTIFLTGLLVEDNVPMQVHNVIDKSLVKEYWQITITQNYCRTNTFLGTPQPPFGDKRETARSLAVSQGQLPKP